MGVRTLASRCTCPLVIVLAALTIFPNYAFSQQALEQHWRELEATHGVVQKPKPTLEQLAQYGFELGTEFSSIDYEEPNFMEQKGLMYGIVSSYTYRSRPYFKSGRVMVRGEGRFSYGQVDYTSNGTGSMDNIDDYMLEFRGLGGPSIPIGAATTFTPYMGFGYRYLNDDSSGMTSSTGAGGYERESNYYYSPVGAEFLLNLKHGWSVGLGGEYDIFWKGVQKSHLSDVLPSFNDLENDQNGGFGTRGSIQLRKKTKHVDFVMETFIRYWDIQTSDSQLITFSGFIVGVGHEPANNSIEYGCKLALVF